MGASLIVEMDGKKTRLHKAKLSLMRDNLRETTNDFTFDYSYWSFDATDKQYTTQEQVYKDLGTDVINCAFQGKDKFVVVFWGGIFWCYLYTSFTRPSSLDGMQCDLFVQCMNLNLLVFFKFFFTLLRDSYYYKSVNTVPA